MNSLKNYLTEIFIYILFFLSMYLVFALSALLFSPFL